MGEVYRASDTALGRSVAIKVLPDVFASDVERLARFEREARTLAALNHPNIAQIYGLERGEASTGAGPAAVRALVMELVEGPTLADRMAAAPIPIEEALPIARQIAVALEAAHEQGIVHRDLKPANIKIRPDDVIKVLDFGLAKALDPAALDIAASAATITSPAMTQAGVILGTAAYMSPEQARGKPADKRADIWAFGCILFEMLTGTRLFEGETVAVVLAGVLSASPDWSRLPRNLHPRIRLLLERCLERNPHNRYRDIGDARVDIEQVLADPATAWPLSASSAAPLVTRRVAMWLAGIVVVAILIVSALVGNFRATETRAVARFAYLLPEGQSFPGEGRVVAVAPDGSSIVYVAGDRLHRRLLGALEAEPIRGTEGSPTAPFFSPDGRSIGYLEGAPVRSPRLRLRRIDVTGGTPVTVSDLSSFFGASWGADDSIVFGQADGIWKVPASGGTPERLVAIQAGEQLHLPQMLPDGKSVLFTLTAGVGDARWDDDARVVVQSLDTGQRDVIRTGASNARYMPTGHLLYVFRSVLFAIPYDVATHKVRGAPVPVVESVLRGALYPGSMGGAGYDVSDDGTLVYAPSTSARTGPSDVVTVDHVGKSDVLVRERRRYWRPAVSPDGERVVVEVSTGLSGAENSSHLWMIDRRRVSAQPFTFDGATNWAPVWSRDGQSIVFLSDRDKVFGIYRKPADGSREPELIHRSNLEVVTTSASPDGIVAFSRGPQTGARDIWTVNLSDRSATEFLATAAMEHMAMFSPDGKWIAYASNESGQTEVYVRPYPKVEGRVSRVSQDGGTAPIWAPDSSALYYRNAKGMLMAAPVQLSPVLTIGTARPLFQVSSKFRPPGNTAAYDITPDGKRFVMTTLPDIADRTPEQIHVVVNWREELKQRVPTR